jgi:hypothetical protein
MEEYTKTLHEVALQQLSRWFKISPGFSSYTERMISSSNWIWRYSFGVTRSVSLVTFAISFVTFVRFAKASLSLLSEKQTPSKEHVKKSRFPKTMKILKCKHVFCDTSVRSDDMIRVGLF